MTSDTKEGQMISRQVGTAAMTTVLFLAMSGGANAQSLSALKGYCAKYQSDQELIQCGTAGIRAQCRNLIAWMGTVKGKSGAATQALGKVFFHADKCVKRSDTFTGSFSWAEALANLNLAQQTKSAISSADLDKKEGHADGADPVTVAGCSVGAKDPAQRVAELKRCCSSLRAKLEAIPKNSAYGQLKPDHKAVVDSMRAIAKSKLDQCDLAVRRGWTAAVGMGVEAAHAVGEAEKALSATANRVQKEMEAKRRLTAEQFRTELKRLQELRQKAIDVRNQARDMIREAKVCFVTPPEWDEWLQEWNTNGVDGFCLKKVGEIPGAETAAKSWSSEKFYERISRWSVCVAGHMRDALFCLGDVQNHANRIKDVSEAKPGCKWETFKKKAVSELKALGDAAKEVVDKQISRLHNWITDTLKPKVKEHIKQNLRGIEKRTIQGLEKALTALVAKAGNWAFDKVITMEKKAQGAAWFCGQIQPLILAACTQGGPVALGVCEVSCIPAVMVVFEKVKGFIIKQISGLLVRRLITPKLQEVGDQAYDYLVQQVNAW